MVRIKHRYLLLSILSPTLASSHPTNNLPSTRPLPTALTPSSLLTLLRSHIALLFGDYGLGTAASGLKIIYLSPATATAILRCPRASYRMVWAALSFVTTLEVRPRRGEEGRSGGCVIRVVRVSGTIRKAEEEAVRRARQEIVRVKMLEGGEGKTVERMGEREEEGGIEDVGEEDEDEDMDSDSG